MSIIDLAEYISGVCVINSEPLTLHWRLIRNKRGKWKRHYYYYSPMFKKATWAELDNDSKQRALKQARILQKLLSK